MIFDSAATVLAIAIAGFTLELLFGWPDKLLRLIGHPVIWLGHLVTALEARLRTDDSTPSAERFSGTLLVTGVVLLCSAVSGTLVTVLRDNLFAHGFIALCVASLLAARNLFDHVQDVYQRINEDSLQPARSALARIVSRDTAAMAETDICRGAIESLAENTSDGVVAPLFWLLLFGLPGLVFYKAVNTMDSMIGYRNARYLHFGRAAARLDDLVNYIPARLTALLFWLVSTNRARPAIRTIRSEATPHVSPNAGWPESAVALCLHISLGGKRCYQGELLQGHVINPGAPEPGREALGQALALYQKLLVLIMLMLVTLWLWS